MKRSPIQVAARRVQRETGASYMACLQELRRRVAVRWHHYDGSYKSFIEAEADDLIMGWNK